MDERRPMAEAGKLLSIETGEYSDYGVWGFFVVLRTFDPFEERDKFKEREEVPKEKTGGFSRSKFLAYLLSEGLLLEISYSTIHMSQYNQWNDFEFYPKEATS